MNLDEYGEVINGDDTYETIATYVRFGRPVIIGWTDQHGTHFDILFNRINPGGKYGNNFQGGIKPYGDLFVSIMRMGAFAFEIENDDTHPGYFNDKLGGMLGTSAEKIAELINNVKLRLKE